MHCLRTCLEIMNLQVSLFAQVDGGQAYSCLHGECLSLYPCKIKCTAKLTSYLNEYLDELSWVFFRKKDLRSKAWWLSIFYSFCIQAEVRRCLQSLTEGLKQFSWVDEYLHLAVRLFIAASGTYDPLFQLNLDTEEAAGVSEGTSTNQDFGIARLAVFHTSSGYASSGEYLKGIFEDTGATLLCDSLPLAPDAMDLGPQGSSRRHSILLLEDDYASSYSQSQSSLSSTASFSDLNNVTVGHGTHPYISGFKCEYPGCAAEAFPTQVSPYSVELLLSILQYSSTFSTAMLQSILRTVPGIVLWRIAHALRVAKASREGTR